MTTLTALLTNRAYGFPQGRPRRVKPVALLCIHITGNRNNLGPTAATAERNYANRAGSGGPSAHDYINRDGSRVSAIDPHSYAAWSNGGVRAPMTAQPGVAAVLRFAPAYNVNEAYYREVECVGYPGVAPINAAQLATVAALIAADSIETGLPIDRSTVHTHSFIDSVDRPNCAFPPATRLAKLGELIALARALLPVPQPPPVPQPTTGGADVLAVVKDITRFATPRTFHTKPGTTLRGYDPAKPGVVVKSATWTVASPASFDAVVSITQSPVAAVVPHGAPFIHVATGFYAGLYIAAAHVTADLTPDPAVTRVEIDAVNALLAAANKKIVAGRTALA